MTALSESYPAHHYDLALTLARQAGFPHEVVHTREMERPEYRANPVNRCYYCKDELYTVLGGLARARGLAVIVDGNNADDRGDYRPGRQAAREAGVRSPLDEVGLDKAAIRALAHRAGLPQWDEPASACLSSRVPYEQAVTPEKLRAIEQAETALRALGFRGCRVRHHDDVARLELRAGRSRPRRGARDRAGDRGGGQGRGLPLRRPRSRGISHRQPQRSHPAPGDRLTSVPQPDPAGAPARPDGAARRRGRGGLFDRARRWTWLALAIGLVALLLHVVAGPGHLDDVDAINFTLGVRDFDVAKHQPHPPGYPVLIAAAKVVAGAAHALGGLSWMVPASWTAVPVETAALSLLAMIAGAWLIVAMQPLARAVSGDAETALAAGVLAIACPLALVTVSRPLSDAPGLAAALGVQALLAAAFAQQRGWRTRDVAPAELAATGRLIVLAAFAAGLAIGLRTQTAWLTLPLLILVIADRAGRSAAAAIVGSAVTFTAGVLCWALPLVIASGGPAAYWRAIASQAGEDLEGVDMLFTSTRPVWRLAMNLLQTFVLPWGPLPLAVVVLTLAAIGIVVLLRRDRRGLVLLAGAAAPYAIFHLVWQENVTTRYALPIVPPIALLAAIGLRGTGLPDWRRARSGRARSDGGRRESVRPRSRCSPWRPACRR